MDLKLLWRHLDLSALHAYKVDDSTGGFEIRLPGKSPRDPGAVVMSIIPEMDLQYPLASELSGIHVVAMSPIPEMDLKHILRFHIADPLQRCNDLDSRDGFAIS